MQGRRGFIGVGVLIAVLAGLAIFGGGAYYIVNKQPALQTVSDDFNLENDAPISDTQKSYTNTAFGYSIQYPRDWIIEPERAILDSVNRIRSEVSIRSGDDRMRLLILVNEKEWLLKREAPFKEQIAVSGSPQTAYIFPEGYECRMADPNRIDCSFFVVAIFRNGVWYQLHAIGQAGAVTPAWREILGSFTFTSAVVTDPKPY